MKKVSVIIFLIINIFFTVSCSKANGKDAGAIKSPENNKLLIDGKWEIKKINILDEDVKNENYLYGKVGDTIDISTEYIKFGEKIYISPKYKLKIVDENYVLSYELNLFIKKFMNEKEKVNVVSMIDENSILGEFILPENDKGYIYVKGFLMEVIKVGESSNYIQENLPNKNILPDENIEYNDDVGVMLALKTPRRENEDGSYSREKYRTLWISLKDNKLQSIIEKEGIIFPRMNGIWKLNSSIIEKNGFTKEIFNVAPIEAQFNKEANATILGNNTYKNINFIGNDYIAIEKSTETPFKNEFSNYEILPIDNINSNSGITIEELYSKEISQKFEEDFHNAFNSMSEEKKSSLSKTIDFSNYTVKREDGKWTLVGKILSKNYNESGEDFKLSLKPNKKLLNYDTLFIPWKVLKGDITFLRDAYTAPTGRIAIVLFSNDLAVYKIGNKRLNELPLINIPIEDDEKVIMAEWASGIYVQNWEKAFKDGIEIVNKEE